MAKKGVDWFPIYDEGQVIASLGADGEVDLVDVEIENRGTGVAYGSGAVVGLRMWVTLQTDSATTDEAPIVHVMILPPGLAVPSVKTAPLMKQAEKFYWFTLPLTFIGESGTDLFWGGSVHIKTARKFDQADRLVAVLHNPDAGVFGASAVNSVIIDAYVRED